jgi:tetratricopeptide (TPR) repeat protein
MKKEFLLILFVAYNCLGQVKESKEARVKRQDSIVEKYLVKGAERYNYENQMTEWQKCLDDGLLKDSTVARLWQEKAMPYFKARKYEVGMEYVNKAVLYDRKEFLPYRGFIKCIFSKEYKASILDFEAAKKEFGNRIVMDHTYDFYIGLSYLQLNEYGKAEKIFKEYIDFMIKDRKGDSPNPTALFYFGISKYEQKKYAEAVVEFDNALKVYSHFSDAKYYKAICLSRLGGSQEEIKKLVEESKAEAKLGYTMGEYNTVYETYPYQKKWNN